MQFQGMGKPSVGIVFDAGLGSTIEDVLALRPEIIFLPDEPYEFSADDASEIRGPRVIGPFPGHLFTWHGTRTILGLRFLRERTGVPVSRGGRGGAEKNFYIDQK